MKSHRHAKLLVAVAGLITAFAMFSPAAQAEKPHAGYEQFAGCPSPFTENSEIATCIRSETTSGYFKMGNKEVPIEHPITLSGGVKNGFGPLYFNSEGGLTKVKQKVPGGVIGLTGLTWLAEFLGSEALTLYATTELAGTPIIGGLEFTILPIKVHLENAALGSKCYVGSSTSPITLKLVTTVAPSISFNPVLEITKASGGTYEDKTFAAPGANGCVLTLFGFIPISINGLVNSSSGLPAASGTNATLQNWNAELVNAHFPYE
jgi:hypothetical protein